MISNNTRSGRRLSLLALLVISALAVLLVGAGSAQAIPADGGVSINPWIQSDQIDYHPGTTVTLTGGNWQPGESVHIFVDDTNGHTWNHTADVTADDQGQIQDVFDLPDLWVSDYSVTATGAASGTATSAFTDSKVNTVTVASPLSPSTQVADTAVYGTVTINLNGNNNPCTVALSAAKQAADTGLPAGAAAVFGNGSFTSTGGNVTSSLSVTTTGATPVGTYTFHVRATDGTGCQDTNATDSGQQLTLIVTKADQTITFGALGNKTFGDAPFTVSATGGGSGNPVIFTASGACTSGSTNGATITITGAGSCTVNANQPGNGNYNAAPQVQQSFTIAKASSTTAVSCPTSVTYDGSAKTPCTATVTGAGGLSQSPAVSYSANTNAGTVTASASFGGDGNHTASSDSKTFTINQASSSTVVSCPTSVTYDGTAKTPCTATVTGAGGLSQSVTVGYSANTNAGTVTASATFGGDTNHTGSSDSKTFTIAKATPSVSVSWSDWTFDGTAHSATGSVSGVGSPAADLGNPDSFTYYSGSTATGSPLAGAPTNAGTYTVVAHFNGNGNYTAADSASKTVTVSKATPSVSVSWPGWTFDGTAHAATGSVSGVGSPAADLGSPDFTYYAGAAATGTPLAGAPKDAGTYTVRASFAGNGNYTTASSDKTTTVDKASSVTSVSCPASVTYDGSAKTPCTANVTGVGGLSQSLTVSYSSNTNAGTATASASFGGDANHTASSDSKTFAIDRADASVSVTWDTPQTFDGGPHPASAVVNGVGGATDLSPAAQLTFYPGNDTTGTALVGAPTDAGTYTVRASFAGNANYNQASATKTITIGKADSTTVVTCPASVTYNGSARQPCSANVTGAGGLDQAVDVTYSDNTNAGTATASASFGGDANHKPSSDSKTFAIDKADASVTITWNDGTYTTNPHPASAVVDGVGGETDLSPAADLTYYSGSTATGSPLAGAPTAAGTYTVRADFAGNGNYKPASATQTITIDKADASVSITWNDGTYTTTPHPASAVVDGVGGETALSPAADLTYYAASTATGTPLSGAPTDAGTYTVRADFAGNGNYKSASAEKTITIDKADASVTITWNDGTYTTNPHPASGSVSGVGSPAQDLGSPGFAYYSGSDATGTPLPGAPTDAGTYTVKADFAGNGNYKPASATKTITIDKADASVTITWNDATYNTNPHPASAVVDGVGGETALSPAADLTYYAASTATGTPLPGAPTDAGTYTVQADFAGNGNYKSASATKTITIDRADASVTITWSDGTYNGDPQPASAVVDGVGGETALSPAADFAYYSGSTATGTALPGAPTDAGTYTVRASFAGNGNYKPASATKTITIDKASSTTIVSCPSTVTFDGSAQTPCSANVTGAGGLNASVTVTYTDNTNAGTATASANYGGDDNHKASDDSQAFTIDKASSTTAVTCPDSVTYDGTAQEPCTAAVTGAGGLHASLTVGYSHNTDAGTATASASFAGDDNHTASDDSKTFEIAKASSTTAVTCPDSVTYDGTAQEPCTAAVTGAGGLHASVSVGYSHNTDAGTATASASFAGDANHESSDDSKTFAIDKAESSTAVTCPTSVTFDGSAQTPCTAEVTGAGGLHASLSVSYSDNTNAGTATASASFDGDANHKASDDSTTFTIARATPSVSVSWPDWTFDGTAHAATGSVSGVGSPAANLGAPDSFSYYSGPHATGSPLAGAPTDAGTYTVVAHFNGNGNYTPADSAERTVTVSKATPSVSVTWADWTFDGTAHAATGSVSGVGSPAAILGTPDTFSYYSGSTASGSALAGAPMDAGTYTVVAHVNATANYTGADSAPKTVTVSKATSSVSVTWADWTFDGTAHPASGSVSGVGSPPAALGNPDTFRYYTGTTTGGSPLSGGAPSDAGTYTVVAHVNATANYTAADSGPKTVTVSKATPSVSVTWAGWTFDGTAHAATGSVSGVGSPAANVGAADSFSYYSGSHATGSPLAGAPKDAGTYTVIAHFNGNGNYTAADSAEQTVTVSQATPSVSVTWADPQVYNGNPHPASGSVTGVGSSDLGSPAFTYYSGSTATGSPLPGAPVNAGTYTVRGSFAGNGNYNPNAATKTIAITMAELTVKADDKTKTYNGSPFTAFTRTITGFAAGDGESLVSGTVSFTGSAVGAANAGTYTITPDVSGLSAANYTFKPANGSLTIGKVQLTVKADNKSKPFDGVAFTAFTSGITGFVNGENSSVVSGSVTYTGSAVGASTVGTYAITPVTSGLSATNYSFTAVSGTLTIGAWYATGFYDPVGVNNSEFVTAGGAVPNVSSTGVWNTAKSGSTVPLKFNLYAAQSGMQLTTTASVQSFDLVKLTSCSGTATEDAVDYFATTGATSLRYDGTAGQFIQNWKTPSVNNDTCYRVNVKFLDGSAIYAFFKLRK